MRGYVAMVLGTFLVVGCESPGPTPSPMEGSTTLTALAMSGPIQLSGHGVMTRTFSVEGVTKSYSFMWGPHPTTGAEFSGSYDSSTKTVTCTAGYVYFCGDFPPQTFPAVAAAEGATTINYWPVVVTQHVSAAAEGTVFFAEVSGGVERVYRIDPPSQKRVAVWLTGTNTIKYLSDAGTHRVVRYDGSLNDEAALNADETAICNEVIAEASAMNMCP